MGMNDRENDTMREQEGRQVQQELEDQLREFGDTMSDAFRTGFEGRGMEIGDRAWDVGKAAVHAANFGISEAGKAFRKSRDEYYKSQKEARRNSRADWAKQTFNEGSADMDTSGMPQWARQIFGLKSEQTPVDTLRADGKKRWNGGVALLAVGITFAVIFGLGGVGSFIGLQWLFGTAFYDFLGVTSSVLLLIAAGFLWMTACGSNWMKAGKQMEQIADSAEAMEYHKGLSVEMLADLVHQKPKKTRKLLQKYIRKGWLNAWLDEKTDTLYLTAEDYRTAQEAKKVQPEPQPKAAPEAEKAETPLNLETARRFAKVLQQEQQLMRDEQGVEELQHMQKTTEAICEWLEAHPESLPKARRFAEYYIPTTLKLLHTYNDVQGQKGGNAESIRRDIAGILHTLNQAYDTLYDNLLSDVALDVSSEIAALQGMLANDGLTGEGLR